MRITLTVRRLAVAAALVLAGALAPLAYSALGKAGSAVAAPSAAPLGPASVTTTQAPSAVADNPYQIFVRNSGTFAGTCNFFPLPAGQDFVLESVSFVTVSGTMSEATINPFIKTGTASQDEAGASFAVALDADGDGTRAFNLVVRPDEFAAAAVGDIHGLNLCVTNASPGSIIAYDAFVTGQRIGAAPTASTVLDFRARRGSTGMALHWTTGSEAEMAGFNIWRYRGAKGVKVNRTLIRAKRSGEPAGATYRFVDRVAGGKRGLTYRLQFVDLKGKRTWYAAFAVAS